MNNNLTHLKFPPGNTYIEMMIAFTLLLIVAVALVNLGGVAQDASGDAKARASAAELASEGIEALRSVRDADWTTIQNLSEATVYYLHNSAGNWSIDTNPEGLLLSVFTRSVRPYNVYRQYSGALPCGADGLMVTSGGFLDTCSKRLNVNVSYRSGERQVNDEIILTKWR